MRQGLVSSLLDKMADLRANPQVNSNFTFVLVVTGPLLVFLTFYAMQPIKGGRASLRFILTADFVYILFITTLLIRRIVQLAAARRAQSAGSRLHFRLTTAFGVIALFPTILVAIFAVLSVNQALEGWFSERVRNAVIAVMLGARRNTTTPPHNPGFVMLGAAMLWVGWFGFNGGSQLAADGGAAMALTVTHISAAAASLTWALWERIKYGKASLVGMVTGTIAGLASITPASGFVGPIEALLIGSVAGILCQEAVNLVRNSLKIDDTLDVFAVHGVGGIFGTIMIAVFGAGAWVAQIGSLVIVGIFTVVVTVVLVKLVSLVTPLRVSEEDEYTGLDLAAHGERAYDHTS
ncbi:hypothetical protein N9W76_03735 [Planktomarina temperata]|nr:hypothetical protein [Planktomarina temperata]